MPGCPAAAAAGHELTARTAADVLAAGGNAVDATVAAAAISWAAEPGLISPCGGGFLLVRPARTGKLHLLDAFTAIPGHELPPDRRLGTFDRVDVPFDEQTTQVFHIGAAACAVPGVVAGIAAAHLRSGKPWRDLLMPAAVAANDGVASGAASSVLQAIQVVLTHTEEARAVFAPGGRFVQEGERVRQPDLAGTIERLAELGPRDFYDGGLAAAMVDHQDETGGRLTMADLAAYRAVWRRPLRIPYHGRREISTNPPPSSGGVLIGHMLAVLRGVSEPLPPGRARTLRAYAEAMRSAARLRDGRFERLLHRGGLARHMLSDETVGRGRAALSRPSRASRAQRRRSRPTGARPHLGRRRGRKRLCLHVVERLPLGRDRARHRPSPEQHDGRGGSGRRPGDAAGDAAHEHAGADDGRRAGRGVELVVSSSGSNRLRSAITQVAINVIDHGMGAREAIDHPRVHVEGDRLDCEGGFDPAEIEKLERWGERVNRFAGLNLYFGGANAVVARGRARGRRRPAPQRRRVRALGSAPGGATLPFVCARSRISAAAAGGFRGRGRAARR